MSENRDSVDWLEKAIANEHLDYFEYSEFKNIQLIGNGAFGNVFRADWKNTDTIVALKFFNNQESTLNQVVNELKLHRRVQFHANILKFYGITKTETNVTNNYSLVLEYADGGTLKTYLDEHFNELKWDDKLCLALQLANAIYCLHERDIIHCDLHANNILVHQKNIKLADFGLSKKIAEASNKASKIFGVLPYIDPNSFSNRNYKLNKKSDIYSVGVIMWQISSGHQPFENVEYDVNLTLMIQGGEREKYIDGTPFEYSNLYTKCWKHEPNERPDMQEVVETLKLITPKENNLRICKEKEHYSNDKISENTTDLYNRLIVDSDLVVDGISVSKVEYMQEEIDLITVQIDDPSRYVLARLNLKDQLSKTRERLEQNTKVNMNNSLLFAKKINQTNNTLTKIKKDDEANVKLEDIIDGKILYLQFNWKELLKDKCKLDYGCTIALDKATKRAFTIEDCELTEIDELQDNTIEIESKEDWITKANLFLAVETTNVQDFTQLGVSAVENFKKPNVVTNYTCNIIECSKASLKFIKLKATEEFINEVNDVLESKDPRKFKNITKEFGQFIPKEVILGGRVLFKGLNAQNEYTKEEKNDINRSGPMIVRGISAVFKNLIKNDSKHEGFKLVGGEQFSSRNFDEQAWIESLKEFRNWDCIKYKNPISTFQLLPEDLRKKIFMLIGKKILYTNTEDYFYKLSQPGKHQTFRLKNVPENILKILRNEDAKCNIFATVVCTKKAKGDIFNCQVLWPPNNHPRLIIHCIQKEFKKRECKLKIRLMIIGYDINFNFNRPNFDVQLKVQNHEFKVLNCQTDSKLDLNYDSSVLCFGIPVLRKLDYLNNSPVIGHHFYKDEENNSIGLYTFSYCLEENHYVCLPDFTFYTLIISNYSNSNNCGILPFKHHNYLHKFLNFTKPTPLPKYISLYFKGKNNCGPIFLKQRVKDITLKELKDLCNKHNCICRNNTLKKSKKNLEYVFFDPES